MEKTLKGKTFDIQGFSVHDGPGIRITVFLKGCPLRCPWCHSPESQLFETELNWMQIRCIGTELCGNCLNVCPHDAITPGSMKKARTVKRFSWLMWTAQSATTAVSAQRPAAQKHSICAEQTRRWTRLWSA